MKQKVNIVLHCILHHKCQLNTLEINIILCFFVVTIFGLINSFLMFEHPVYYRFVFAVTFIVPKMFLFVTLMFKSLPRLNNI